MSSADRGVDRGVEPRPDVRGLYRLKDWQIVPAPEARPLAVADARALDRLASERFGIPTLLLMERAALGLEVVALEMLRRVGLIGSQPGADVTAGSALTSEQVSGTVVILCGPGSNGGDGFALGRLLLDRGIPAVVLAAPGAGASGDAKVNRAIFERLGGEVRPQPPAGAAPALIVDALFGTGLSRPVEGPAADLMAWAAEARRAGAPVLAVDMPSGLDTETGEALGPAVTADTTVTLVGPKPGLLTPAGRARCGRIVIAPIGVEGIIARASRASEVAGEDSA